jgi:hypothetical protein
MQLAVYSENGHDHPLSCVIATPTLNTHSIQIKNTGPPMDDPLGAVVMADMETMHGSGSGRGGRRRDNGLGSLVDTLTAYGSFTKIDGCSEDSSSSSSSKNNLETYDIREDIQSVQVLIRSDFGRPCNARIELTDSNNLIQQVVEVYVDDGQQRPFFAVLETPNSEQYTVRVVNVGNAAFPITTCVEPFFLKDDEDEDEEETTRTRNNNHSPYGYHESEHIPQQDYEFFYAE